jgi:3-oxoacyl-[acyl-carrier protein] reductase
LAKHGVAVCVNYAAHADAANELVTEITGAGGRAIAAAADVADAGAVAAWSHGPKRNWVPSPSS